MQKYKYWFLTILGSVVWSLTMVKSGLIYKYGMGFWGANGHDGVWHISLINSLSRGSLEMPIFAGEQIHNYHLGFDIFVALLVRLTGISSQLWYFQILPPIFAILIGYLIYKLTRSLWSVFFVYFGGSLGWIVSWIRNGTWGGESMFWSQQAISTLINPPFAMSLIFLLTGLILLRNKKYFWATIIFGLVGSIKIYAGIIGLTGLAIGGLRNPKLLLVFLGSSILSFLLFIPLNSNASNLLVFQPGWFLETMMGLSDRLNWPKFYSAMVNYKSGKNLPKEFLAYTVALLVFIVGNLGTRLIPLFRKFNIQKITWFDIFILQACLLGVFFPMLFLQAGTPWNTIQFFYYTQFFIALVAGISLSKINNKFISVLIIVLTIPTTINTMNNYLPARPPAMISTSELEALKFFHSLPSGVILTPVVNSEPYAEPPRPLYLYTSTAYVSAFSGHQVFLEDEINLDITGYPWRERRKEVEVFFNLTDISKAREFLNQNNIDYIYLPQISQIRPKLSDTQLGFQTIFENSQSAIWSRVGN